MPNDSCDRPCPHSRGICRREFLKIAAATGLLVACSPRRQAVVSPTDTPLTPTNTPAPTPTSVPPAPTNTPALTEESPVDKYIAYCGYDCTECQYYGGSCDGCLASNDQQLRSGALECGVRACNMERGLANCGHCEEYPCEKLEAMFSEWMAGRWAEAAREAKAVLDEVHQSLP